MKFKTLQTQNKSTHHTHTHMCRLRSNIHAFIHLTSTEALLIHVTVLLSSRSLNDKKQASAVKAKPS